MTSRSRVPAMSSAWPTAARIARSASSMSVMPPPRTPRPFCQPKPSTRSVQSDSDAADHADDLGGADVEHAERRRTAVRGVRDGGSIGSIWGGSTRRGMSFISVPSGRLAGGLRVLGVLASLRSVCGRTTSRSGRRMSIASSGRSSSAWSGCRLASAGPAPPPRAPSGSMHVGTVVHAQVPAPLAHPHRGDHAALDLRPGAERVDQRRRRRRRAEPTTSGSWRRTRRRRESVTVVAVAVDQHELAVVLPDGERPALLELHHDGAGQAALDGRALHPVEGLDARRARRPARSRRSDRPCARRGRRAAAARACSARPSITTSLHAQPEPRGRRCRAARGSSRRGRTRAARRRSRRPARSRGRRCPGAGVQQPPLPAQQQLHRPGRSGILDGGSARGVGFTRGMRRSPPSRRRVAGNSMPRCAACSGSSEVGVRPGCVLISSSTRRPGSPAVSS